MASSEKPLLIFVPGSFHTPANYTPLTTPLRSLGYEILTPTPLVSASISDPNPDLDLTFLDDAAAIRSEIAPLFDAGRTAVVISHSYGSIPATHTTVGLTVQERRARGENGGIMGVINIAGFAFPTPEKGIMGDDALVPPPEYHCVENGIATVLPSAIPLFFGGLESSTQEAQWSLLNHKQTRRSFTEFPRVVESQIRCRKVYVLCEEDMAVAPAWQEGMARTGGYEVVRVKSGHAPFVQCTDKVIEIIEGVVQGGSEDFKALSLG
ncbi:Alpha/beta hydrolase fold-1 [Aspergillus granulosus]|uniref:Alpha/beta hydrolase fold-1 n=1 Tax=Aspergillus granulosus TaxID=176169 RepID=A0ABR4HNH4_9EURO